MLHRVNRLEIELHSDDVALARALSGRAGRMHRERIAPVLDRVCSELGAREALIRIDRLDLDLGTFAADDLEDAFVARLEPALRAALARALRQTAGDQRPRASLELLETFALTGGLPWWAPQDREVVARHFARATVEARADLAALLDRIAHDPGALDRIARMCGGHEALVEQHARARDNASGGTAGSAHLPAGDEAMAQPSSETSRLTAGTSRRRPLGDPDALTSDPPRRRPLGDPDALVERHARARDTAGAAAGSAPQPSGGESMAQPPPGTSRLTSDASGRRQLADPDALICDTSGRQPLADPEALVELHVRARDTATGGAAGSTPQPAGDEATPLLEGRAPVSAAAIRAARRGALARLDELYVADAGLVILWPFLERFLLRTGVLGDDRRFVDEVAQLQAVALVEGLATADLAPLEFHLPLAKLLCGRPFESDFVLERPLAPEQLAEGDRLLAAVIDRAPLPADLSISSFRTGFLARPGALGTRDGAWLLQVERRPHDAVLDRFPWSWRWIKLPWMPEPLRVDW